jgi:hypothetical protein
MRHKAPDPREPRPLEESPPRLFPEHYVVLAIWIASVVLAIVALVR